MARRLCLLGLLLLTACPKSEDTPPDQTVEKVEKHDAPSPAAGTCKELKDAYRAVLAAAETTCMSDGDCACGPGGIDPGGCGRVMNRASAEKLFEAYSAVGRAPDCGLDFNCGPRKCLPRCIDGKCTENAP